MEVKDLIPDRFYCIDEQAYFKFKKCDDVFIYNYAYQIKIRDEKLQYVSYGDHEQFATIELFHHRRCYEIHISLIIDYLPDTDIDKKFYIRQQKINSLLNI